MKSLKVILLASTFFASSLQADGFGFHLGPFNLQFDASRGSYIEGERTLLDAPICRAIRNQERLEIVVQGKERINSHEMKKMVKRLVIEPYFLGITREGKPILRGNIVEEKLIKEVSIKYGEDEFDEPFANSKEKKYFSGTFSSDKNQVVDVRKIVDIKIIKGSNFDIPRGYRSVKDDNIQIVCELPTFDDERDKY